MNKLTKQLLSLLLCVLMVIESGFNAGLTGYATEKAVVSEFSVYAVKVLADLKEDVAYQTVEFGTPESSLNLPKTIFALASDEEAEHIEDEEEAELSEDEEEISTSSKTKKTATESTTTVTSADFMTDDQKEAIKELLSGEERPSVKDLEKSSGLDLTGYTVIKLPLTWESDTSFGGEYDPKQPGVYSFVSEVKNEEKYVLYDSALPTVSVEVLEENQEAFSAAWTDEDADLEITVTAPAGVFPKESVLQVERISEEKDNKKIEEAVEKTLDNDKAVKDSFSYDIKVTDPDGNELEPVTAGGKKVEVTFKSQALRDAALEEDQYVSVYHFQNVDKEDVEKAARAKDDEEESLIGEVVDSVVSFVTQRDSGEKLRKPEHMKTEEPEEAAVDELEAEETDSEEKSAPETDDSANVSSEGELTVTTKDFSIYTVAFYSDKSAIKAYYVTLGSENSKYSYEDGDTLTLSITAEGGEEKKIAVIYPDEESFEAFRQHVTSDPDDLLTLLENEAATVGSEISGVPARTGNIGLIADSDGINIEVTSLQRNGVTYKVKSTERTIDSSEPLTFKGLYWDLDETFYVEQDATGLQGTISYELSGFGSNGGEAAVTITGSDGSTRTVDVSSDAEGKASFTVDASDKSFTIDSTDILKIKPADSEYYSYTPDGGADTVSIDPAAPTSFSFTNLKDYTYTVHQTVKQDGSEFETAPQDKIDYVVSGLAEDEEVSIHLEDGASLTRTADGSGKIYFDLEASVASFSVIAKDNSVEMDSATPASGNVNNIILVTDLSSKNLSHEDVLDLEFDVPEFEIQVYGEGVLLENTESNTVYETKYTSLENLNDVSALFDVPGYRFKSAKLVMDGNEYEVSEISNFLYKKKDGSDAEAIDKDAVLKLYYDELISYPVYLKTENVTVPTDICLKVGDLDSDCIAEVYLLDATTKEMVKPALTTTANGSYKFTTVVTSSDYYLVVMSDDKDITLMVDDSNKKFQQHAGTGVDPINLKKKTSEDDYDGNTLFVEYLNSSIVLRKLWEDGGKNNDEKNTLIGKNKDVKKFMHLEYYIEGISTEWKTLDVDAMKDVLGYHADEAKKALNMDNASFTYTGPTSYDYNFRSKLYSSYVYRDASGVIQTAPIKYRIAEGDEIKAKYFSKYENENEEDDPNGTILRNYEIQTYTATIKWNDADARKSGSTNLDRPSTEEWINSVTLHKVVEGKTDSAATVSIITDKENVEGAIKVTDNGDDTWTVEIRGYGYDRNDYNVHYYLTEKLDGLPDDIAREGNKIINRHYEPEYNNVSSAANVTDGLYKNGTLVNVLAGDTTYTMYKIWKDDGKIETVHERPKAEIIFYRYSGTNTDAWRHLSPIQNAEYKEIKKNIGTEADNNVNKYYELTLPLSGYTDAYNGDGTQFVYVGKERMSGGSNHYEQQLLTKENELTGLHEGVFILNGESLVNTIEDKVKVEVTKTWQATARQDTESKVPVTLYKSLENPESYNNLNDYLSVASASEVETKVLEGFSSEVTSKSCSWTLEKYDAEGNRLYYFVREGNVQTKVNGEFKDAQVYTDSNGKTYFLTADGYRYIQSITTNTNTHGNVDTHIENRLVGNAQVKLVKKFPQGLSLTDQGKDSVSFAFDVFQDKSKIGRIVRTYKVGGTYNKLNEDGTVTQTTINSMEELKDEFTDVIIIDSYDDPELAKESGFESYTGLLPRYTLDGTEYTYSIFEHEDAEDRGYIPTVVNAISEETYAETNETVINPYFAGKDKYLLDSVEITNGTGGENYITVYKEWLDGEDSERREPVTFVLEQNKGAGWEQVGTEEYTINPRADKYSKYLFIPIPGSIKVDFNNWRNNNYTETAGSGSFRVRETKLGDSTVHYYTGKEGETIVKDFPNKDYYLGHDWSQYEGNDDTFKSLTSETDDYGFVQGKYYDFDVLVVDSEAAQKASRSYINYQYFEEGNVIGNRNFDFALSNVRVGVIYIDIKKTWDDGEDYKDSTDEAYTYRPDEVKLLVKVGDDTTEVRLNRDNNWSAKLGPFRKYDSAGQLINYNPHLEQNSEGKYEEFIYGDGRDADSAEKYAKAYSMSGDTVASLTLGQDHHTGDVYSIAIHNVLNGTVTPVVNKFWEDYDQDDAKENKRPDIYSKLWRSYTDKDGNEHVEQIDKNTYYDYDWNTVLDEKTHNWWQVRYKPLPRFRKEKLSDGTERYYEYFYYISEEYASENKNEYAEIGAFPRSPEYTDDTHQVAKYDYDEADLLTLKVSDTETIVAAKVTLDPDKASTLVNRPRNKRTVTGVKVYNNLPKGYVAKNLPDVKIQLWRKAYKSTVEERVHEYTMGTDLMGNEILVEKSADSYLNTILQGANSLYKREFTFYSTDENGQPTEEQALVPKYDDTGRPYTYFIKEDADTEKERDILEAVYDFEVESDDTLTNGIQATNAYKPTENYDITFYKKWTGFDPVSGTYDDKYLRPDVDTPQITVRLYRYLQDKDGNVISGTEEKLDERTLHYDKDHPEYTSYTWKNLVYYAPNLNPYKYVVAEKIQADSYTRGYEEIYKASVVSSADGKAELIATGSNLYGTKQPIHSSGWYDLEVEGSYDLDGRKGEGTAAVINTYTKIRTSLYIKKLWSEVQNYKGIKVLPDHIDFELYRVRDRAKDLTIWNPTKNQYTYLQPNYSFYIDTISLDDSNDWTATVSNLLKYEPRGWYYRYYVREVVPDNWNYIPFTVTTKDAAFWNGGIGQSGDGTNGIVHDENGPMVTGRKNILKTVSLEATKEFKDSKNGQKISKKDIVRLHELGVIPDTINYRVYYKIQDGTSGWKLLEKDGENGEPVSISSTFKSDGTYTTAKVDGLMPYAFNNATNNYDPIDYRAVEYSVRYGNDPEKIRSSDSINAELSGETTGTGFEGFTAISSDTEKTDKEDENHPYKFATTVTNTLDLTELDVTKVWDDEVRGFGSRISEIRFKLQRATESSVKHFVDVEIDGKTVEASIKRNASSQKAYFYMLPAKDKDGRDYSYRAVETKIVLTDGTEMDIVVKPEEDDPSTGNQTGGTKAYAYSSENGTADGYGIYKKVFTTKFTNRLRLGSIVVNKKWEDFEDKYRLRPGEIKVKLTSSIPLQAENAPEIFSNIPTYEVETKTLKQSNNWTASWSELPVYDANDNEVIYTLEEYYVGPDGQKERINSYDATNLVHLNQREVDYDEVAEDVTVADNKATEVTFINTLATQSFIVDKYWDTAETDETDTNAEYERIVHVKLQARPDGENNWADFYRYVDDNGDILPNGEVVTANLSSDNNYSFRWDDLPETDNRGRFLYYQTVETSIEIVRKVNGQIVKQDTRYFDSDKNSVGGYNYESEVGFAEDMDNVQKASIKNILKKAKYSITKVWDDDDDRDGMRPDSVTFHLQRMGSDGEWTQLPAKFDRTITNQTAAGSGEWTIASWSELPVEDPFGDSYSYRAVEDEVSGYKMVALAGEQTLWDMFVEGLTNIYNTFADFIVSLFNGDTAATEERTYEDEGVILEEGGLVKSTYSNIHKISTVDVSAVKKWDDKDDKYGDRPKEITVTLYASYTDADGNTVEEPVNVVELQGEDKQINGVVTLGASNNWTYTWTDLPEFKRGLRGARISYSVKENVIDGYTGETTVNVTEGASGKKTFEITIKNTLTPRTIVVRKNWENEYAGIGKTVTGAEVVLQRKTENTDWANVYETVNGSRSLMIHVINKTDTSWTVTDLPVCDDAGNLYLYRAVESRIYLSDGSSVNVNAQELTNGTVGAYVYTSDTTETETGFRTDITNRFDTASLKVSKIWSDENDKNKKRPQELKITLKASTVVNGTTTDIEVDGLKKETILNAANNWTDDTTWASVPVYTADGKRIYYTFTEQNITSYKSSYESVSYGTTAVTGDGTTAARVFTESGQVSEVIFTNSYTDGGNNNGGGGSSGGNGSVRGISRDNPSDSTDDGEVLGANRENPEVPEVLGATRRPQTGDESNMMYYGIGAVVSLAVLAAWFYADKKRKKAAKAK